MIEDLGWEEACGWKDHSGKEEVKCLKLFRAMTNEELDKLLEEHRKEHVGDHWEAKPKKGWPPKPYPEPGDRDYVDASD